ncbi:cytochrome P450 [Cinnamomum micranthum f. kanehirae]|uniref:Cytochrome P450 n=1 Tax=Cinnamomum micranthum f. kanehirae TaxID=337451 RepID=A0A3S3NCC5_9MAGN|nr:cytochrome P450 [Cinnamomum micranthum f. kanehirae]
MGAREEKERRKEDKRERNKEDEEALGVQGRQRGWCSRWVRAVSVQGRQRVGVCRWWQGCRVNAGGEEEKERKRIEGKKKNILVAGTDTVSATLTWFMSELVRNPKALRKAQDEVRRCQENRHCKIVLVNAQAIGRDLDCWEHPNEFMPERFMGSEVDYKGQHFELIPFGAGRRICPGMLFGTTTVELALANLLYFFNWELPLGTKMEEMDMSEEPGLTVHKKYDLLLVATNYDISN